MRFVTVLIGIAICVLIISQVANAHLARESHQRMTRAEIHAVQGKNLAHARYVCNQGANAHKRWACRAVRWLQREWKETAPLPTFGPSYWMQRQIAAATHLAQNSGADPWPNCPDPYFNGASWSDTVACENGGNWLDSPGFYRCGLQFHPNWESVYGRLCP